MPDSELKELLQKNLELTAENNRILRSMRRMAFWGGLIKFVVWGVLLIGLPLAAYYVYVAPYLPQLLSAYAEFESGVSEVRSIRADLGADNPLSNLLQILQQQGTQQ